MWGGQPLISITKLPTAPVHVLRPKVLSNGFVVDYLPADPEIGGIDLIIWRSNARDEGFLTHCADWRAVHHFMRGVEDALKGRK